MVSAGIVVLVIAGCFLLVVVTVVLGVLAWRWQEVVLFRDFLYGPVSGKAAARFVSAPTGCNR